MLSTYRVLKSFVVLVILVGIANAQAPQAVKEVALEASHGVNIKVRMEGPYTAEIPLQVVCYFPYSEEAVGRMKGAPVELDNHLGGIIGSLRQRGEFTGTALESLVITPPSGSISAEKLLLIGLGDESELSPELLTRVGQTAFRTAADLGARKVAFAPLIRDQGNTAIPAGDVEVAVLKGMLLANDTQIRLQNQGLANKFVLQDWNVEAGPTFFDETVEGVKKAIEEANGIIAERSSSPYQSTK